MSRFASLSSPSSRVRGLLQARLYYAREKNREKRKDANLPMSLAGAKVGDLSAGGSLPTGWAAGSPSNFKWEVLSLEKRDNHDSIIIRISGTNNSGGTRFPAIKVMEIPAVPGEKYDLTYLIEVLDITAPANETPRNSLQSRLNNVLINPGSYVNLPNTWASQKISHTVLATANELWVNLLDNSINDGAAVDITFQIANMKLRRVG